MRETEELAHLDREIERLLRRRLELVAGPESGSTGYDQCRRAMEAARCPVSQPRVVYQGVAGSGLCCPPHREQLHRRYPPGI